MKNRETQRAVKNILHNELGITSEKVENLITEYIDKKLNERMDKFMNSRHFEYFVEKIIDKQIEPTVRHEIKRHLSGISINVSFLKSK